MPFRMPDLTPEETLAGMPAFFAQYIIDGPTRARVQAGLEAVDMTVAEWSELLQMIGGMAQGYGRQPTHRLAGAIGRAYLAGLLDDESALSGVDNLDVPGPTLIVANHLGYTDPLALRELLIRSGRPDLGDRICAVAGPKAYEGALRQFAVASHPSIRVAQSSQIQDGNSARAMVKITRRCLADCIEMLNEGLLVVLFAEGTRSRDSRLQPFIKAVARWVTQPGLSIVPIGHWGSEGLYALDGDRLGPANVFAKVGEPLDVDALKAAGLGRNDILSRVHEAVDALLPPDYQCVGDRLR